MLPSLREERAQTYSPFLPIASADRHRAAGAGDRARRQGRHHHLRRSRHAASASTTPVTGGRCKLQWKPDWAMRWVALGIDYEMAGKDLIDSVKLSRRNLPRARRHAAGGLQLRALPRREGPEDLQVEGQRPHHRGMAALRQPGKPVAVHVSRAEVGEAALLRRHPAPRRRLPAIPRRLRAAGRQAAARAIRSGTSIPAHPPKADMPVTFPMLLTLVSSSNAENAETLWGFIGRYRPGVTPQTHPKLDALVGYAIHYFRDFVLPAKKFREPTDGRARGADRPARCAVATAARRSAPRTSRTWSTRSAGASRSSTRRRRPRTASPASRSTGSTCSTRCCSARRKARASVTSTSVPSSRWFLVQA